MKRRTKLFACLAAGAMFVSAGAMAAVNANELHLALTSLRLALVKMGVANAMLSNPTPPSSNAEAHVAAPNRMSTAEISSILVSTGGVINVYLTPAVGITDGIVQLVPKIVTGKDGKKGVQYTCYSPNIADIAAAAPECSYRPAGK
ncbi:MAG TPA: hypothetical protein VKV22_03445 [Rhodanobacteraceae bacterium]|nr:hypothetical protein [Rhodanobacteraceae bacterium]